MAALVGVGPAVVLQRRPRARTREPRAGRRRARRRRWPSSPAAGRSRLYAWPAAPCRCPAWRPVPRASRVRGLMRKLRWLPMKSIAVRASLPSLRRRPRPSCWRNTTGDSVGRSIRTVSTSGTSRPSLNTSTVQMTCSSPARSCSTEPARGALAGPLCTATAATPLRRKNSAVKSAWLTVTQNARVRPPPLSPPDVEGVLGAFLRLDGLGQRRWVEPAAAPGDRRVVDVVGDPEVAERAQVAALDALGERALVDQVVRAQREQVGAVHAVGGRGKAKQGIRAESGRSPAGNCGQRHDGTHRPRRSRTGRARTDAGSRRASGYWRTARARPGCFSPP